jgi:hypothetical protein
LKLSGQYCQGTALAFDNTPDILGQPPVELIEGLLPGAAQGIPGVGKNPVGKAGIEAAAASYSTFP